MSISELLESHSESESKLKVRLLPANEFERAGFVLLEGNAESLRFLGKLLIAVAEHADNYDLSLHPSGAGRIHFENDSDLGLYINLIVSATPNSTNH